MIAIVLWEDWCEKDFQRDTTVGIKPEAPGSRNGMEALGRKVIGKN